MTNRHFVFVLSRFQSISIGINWKATMAQNLRGHFIILIFLLNFVLFIELSDLTQVSICLPAPKGRCLSPKPYFLSLVLPSFAAGALLISAMYWQSHTLLVPMSLAQLPNSASRWWLTNARWLQDIMRSDRMQMCTSRRGESIELEVWSGLLSHYTAQFQ